MKTGGNKNIIKLASAVIAVLVIGVFADIFHAVAIVGPSNAGGVGSGAIATDAVGNIAIGTSTTQSATKLFIIGSTTDSSAYGLQVWNSASTPTFTVRNDGLVSVPGAITIGGTLTATVNASNVTAGQFAAGNFSFPSSLSISTTTVPSGSLFNIATSTPILTVLSNGNVGISNAAPAYDLDVTGNGHFSGTLKVDTTSSFSGQLSMASGQQITWASTSASNNINMQNGTISGVSKITVAAIDPLYQINGQKYATYGSSIAGGVNEEYVGRGQLQKTDGASRSTFVLNFDNVATGNDLWVWRNAVDFSSDNVEVLATPINNPISIAYNIEGNKIIFTGTGDAEFSYRLIGKRYDWRDWPTYAKNQNETPSIVIP